MAEIAAFSRRMRLHSFTSLKGGSCCDEGECSVFTTSTGGVVTFPPSSIVNSAGGTARGELLLQRSM
jgi:hypothetical protein